jgi:flagellar export protein FliJ
MARFRLAGVLRARQLQEDAARGAVMHARAEAAKTIAEVTRRERALAGTAPPSGVTALAFVAAQAARRSMAAELAAAVAASQQAHAAIDERVSDYTAASIRRRGVEKLGERHATAVRAAEDAAQQRELDDLASTARLRRG